MRYQEQNGQDVVVDTRTPGLTLSRLRAGTPYTFTIEGYGPDGTRQATYGKALFTTPARQLAPPTNLRYSVSSDNVVTIEWDKDKDHRRYQLVYTDPNGVERAFYPTTN